MVLDDDYLDLEKVKNKSIDAMVERNQYLGEYKERVIVALRKEEVSEKFIYTEVKKALQNKEAYKLIISRDIDLPSIKKYINLAKDMKIDFKMVDGLSYVGDIGLVVVARDALSNISDNLIVESFKERFLKAGLDEIYYKAMGKKISEKHYNIILKKLPELIEFYEIISFFDKITGTKCMIEEKLK